MSATMTDDDRWRLALEAATDGESPSFAQALRRKNVTLWVVIGVVFVVLGVLGALLAARFIPDSPSRDDRGWVLPAVGFTLEAGGFALLIINLVRMVRSGRYAASWRSPTRVLSYSQRRLLLRQVKGKAPVDPSLLPLSRHFAAIIAGQFDHALLLIAGIMLTQAGAGLASGGTYYLVFLAVIAVVYLVLLPLGLRQARRARRFLQDHPAAVQPA